jgi:hypothetical protein
MSSPHYANSQGAIIGVSSSDGEWSRLAKHWHLSQCQTNTLASVCMDGQ